MLEYIKINMDSLHIGSPALLHVVTRTTNVLLRDVMVMCAPVVIQ